MRSTLAKAVVCSAVACLLLSSSTVFGSLLEFEGSPSQVITVGNIKVPVYAEARVHVGNAPSSGFPVYLTGAGIRVKQIVFVDTNLYATSSYVDNTSGISKTDPLGSLARNNVKALSLTLLRDLSADEIRSSFEDALMANNVDLDSPGVKELLSKITFDMPAQSTTSIAGFVDGHSDSAFIETSTGYKASAQDKGLSLNFWRVWFGIPVDDGMKALKANLIGK